MALKNPDMIPTLVTLERKQVKRLDALRWELRARDRSALVRQAIDFFFGSP